MKDKVFIDTNIVVYFAIDKGYKRHAIINTLSQYEFAYISIQVLNEFSNTCLKKKLLEPSEIKLAINEYASMFNIAFLDIAAITYALTYKN